MPSPEFSFSTENRAPVNPRMERFFSVMQKHTVSLEHFHAEPLYQVAEVTRLDETEQPRRMLRYSVGVLYTHPEPISEELDLSEVADDAISTCEWLFWNIAKKDKHPELLRGLEDPLITILVDEEVCQARVELVWEEIDLNAPVSNGRHILHWSN